MYRSSFLGFDHVPQFSQTDRAYQLLDERLHEFYRFVPTIDGFSAAINDRSRYRTDRKLLVNTLKLQYATIPLDEAVKLNIDALALNTTFTVITAHQPSILTGPLYFIYKICSVISLSRKLEIAHPDFKIVPTFIMGGEDHDFDEIANLQLYGKKFRWHTDQKGSCGRMNLDGIKEFLDNVTQAFGLTPFANELNEMLRLAYRSSSSYGEFMIRLVNSLFGEYGLVILNMDHDELKKPFVELVIKDIEDGISQKEVQRTQHKLAGVGFKSQAYVREVNVFYLTNDRHRVIETENNSYSIDNHIFSKEELFTLFRNNPGAVSPNVILRPLYQEFSLPNIAYVGGGGELAYWLERKSQFESFGIFYPILMRRDSVLIVDHKSAHHIRKQELDYALIFEREEQIINQHALQLSTKNISLETSKQSLKDMYDLIASLAVSIDPTLGATVAAEHSKAEKSLDYLEYKMLKAEKVKHEVALNRIVKIKRGLFPENNSLQERVENFIPYYLKYGRQWIEELLQHLDPLDPRFKILQEESA